MVQAHLSFSRCAVFGLPPSIFSPGLLKLSFLPVHAVEQGWLDLVVAYRRRLVHVEILPTGWCDEVKLKVHNVKLRRVKLKLPQASFFEYHSWNEQRLLLTVETCRLVLSPAQSREIGVKTRCLNDKGLDPLDNLHLTPFRLDVDETLRADESKFKSFLLNSTALIAHMTGDDEVKHLPAPAADWWNFFAKSASSYPELVDCLSDLSLPACSTHSSLLASIPPVDDVRTSRRVSPLMQAAQECELREMKSLLEIFGASLLTRDADGKSALHHAVGSNCFGGVVLLIESGSKVDEQDSLGYTPLMLAIRSRVLDLEIVRLLLSAGSSPFLVDQSDQTALWWSSWRGNATTVRLLLSLWCPRKDCLLLLSAKNRYGRTPLAQVDSFLPLLDSPAILLLLPPPPPLMLFFPRFDSLLLAVFPGAAGFCHGPQGGGGGAAGVRGRGGGSGSRSERRRRATGLGQAKSEQRQGETNRGGEGS
uniref:CS domain-containing protein n=1 Tax=Guillardia theta TaxID=55529 RepID=A0A7S4L5G7_GUITH|mmetsp:Transcript_37825/g.119535  ORF Transcript_37825/g.119535 Transcript_37825/m.119535 type:complete len:477 (+) Transcript_37825:582-2012(+)